MSQTDLNDLETDVDDSKGKGSSSRSSSRSSRTKQRSEEELRKRLLGCFERISNALAERGDEQLAEILDEDAGIMAQGLVSLTRPFTALRTPLLAVIAIVEPVLAFGRIARVALGRWAERRAERADERAQQEAEQAAQQMVQ